jgi:hypothetical protein
VGTASAINGELSTHYLAVRQSKKLFCRSPLFGKIFGDLGEFASDYNVDGAEESCTDETTNCRNEGGLGMFPVPAGEANESLDIWNDITKSQYKRNDTDT